MSDDTNKPMDGDMPPQMDLFSLVDLKRGDRDEYSNTVDIYDAIPKYVWADRREVKS